MRPDPFHTRVNRAGHSALAEHIEAIQLAPSVFKLHTSGQMPMEQKDMSA